MPFLDGRAISNDFFLKGLKGPKGTPGSQGPKGNHGGTGIQGATGLSGIGSTGIQGVTGSSGIGSTGIQGVTGIEGQAGYEGAQGATGIRGLDGLDGPPGEPGKVGVVSLTSQVSVSNTTSETTILSFVLPPGSLQIGSQFRFTFYGTHQNQDIPGTLTIRMYVGGNAGQIILVDLNSIKSQTYVEFNGIATVRTLGSSGTFITSGIYQIYTSASSIESYFQGGATTTAVNTQAPSIPLQITAQWQTASSDNSLLIQNATIEKIM